MSEEKSQYKEMKVEVIRLDYSWKIELNGQPKATVWLDHNNVKPADFEVMNSVLEKLNTKNKKDS